MFLLFFLRKLEQKIKYSKICSVFHVLLQWNQQAIIASIVSANSFFFFFEEIAVLNSPIGFFYKENFCFL